VTSTSGTIFVLCDGPVFATNVIPFAFEIIRMTGSAERLVLGKWPGNSATDNRAVTGYTAWIHAVVARVVPCGTMGEAGWHPATGGMAHIALFGGV